MASLLQDFRVALRSLRRSPGFTLVAILTLTLGIGANTAIFSVVDGVLLRPLPYPDPDRLVKVALHFSRERVWQEAAYWHLANNNRSFESFGGILAGAYGGRNRQWPLTGDGPPLQVDVAPMTASAFETIGMLPARGRLPTPEEDVPDGPTLALISDGLWVNRYGSDPSIIGRTIELNGMTREVIGVMPADYNFPNAESDVWIPYQLDPASHTPGSTMAVIARLAPGVTKEAAIAESESLIPDWLLRGGVTGEVTLPTLRDQITSPKISVLSNECVG